MKKLAYVLKLAELFYHKAMTALAADPAHQVESLPIVKEFEEMLDEIDNQDLYSKLEKYLNLYKTFVVMLSGPAPETEADETFIDIYEALEKAWEKIVQDDPNSPYTDDEGNRVNYLSLDADSPEYTEDKPPHEIVDLVQRLLSDANEKKREKAAEAGLSSEELESAEKKVQQDMFHGQVTKDVINKMDNAVKDQYKQKVQKQLEYQKKFNQKLKTIKDLGPEHLRKLREELALQLTTTRDPEQKKQLEMRLKSIPDPKHLEVAQEGRIRRHKKMLADPKRKADYVESNKDRQQNRRDITLKFLEVIEKINNSKNPSEIEILKRDLVRMEQQVLRAKKVNLDDDFVLNSPSIQRQLNPDEIIKKYTERASKVSTFKSEEVTRRQEGKSTGTLVGLTTKFQQQLSTAVNEVKKKIQKTIDNQGMSDPFFAPFTKALADAVAAQDQAAITKAQQAVADAVKKYKNEHPLVVAINQKLEPMIKFKDELQALVGVAQRTGKPRNPWISEVKVPEQYRSIIQDIVLRGEQNHKLLASFQPSTAAVLAQIISQLKEKL